MQGENFKKKSLKSTGWSLFDNLSSQGFAFIIGIILARLLSPTDYGTIGVLSIFLAIANVFVDCGFGNALIRKKDRSQDDLSTAFYFNLTIGAIVYFILFISAPLVASFFQTPILVILLRVLALCVVFNSLSIVQTSLLTANLNIKTIAIVNICTQIPIGLVGIYLAYKGLGVWTLVVQQVGGSCFRSLWLWVMSGWRPDLIFKRDSFSYLFNFGWKLVGANLLGTFFNEIYSFVIGRKLGVSDLGLYTKGKQLAEYPRSIINNVINRVVLPVMVETQGDIERVRYIYRILVRLLGFSVFPLFGLLILLGEPIIIVLWTDKWVESIIIFQIFCFGFSFGPISTINFCLLQLMNRTDMTLKLEFIKKPLCLLMLLCGIPFGLLGIVLAASLYNIVGTIINMYPTSKILHYNYIDQLFDFGRGLSAATIAFGILFFPMSYITNLWVRIIIVSLSYIFIYLGILWIFNRSYIKELRKIF